MQGTEFNSPDTVTIKAAQVVFTNVEVDQSPLGHRGFQTVFYTEDQITQEVLQSEIEPALQYFPRNGYGPTNSPPEFVFFPLSSKQIAIGRITPVLDQLDKFGRKKMLFAHVLVFDALEFRNALNNNPFVVLDADPFLRCYDDVFAADSVSLCRFYIPPRTLVLLPSEPKFDPAKFPPNLQDGDSLRKLLLLASAASTRPDKTYKLEVHGPPAEFRGFMRSLFAVIPTELRSECSFDTAFVGDTGQAKSSRSSFWANGVGKGQRLQQDAVILVDLDRQESDLSRITIDPVTPFERWLVERPAKFTTTLTLPAAQQRLACASLLQDVLRGRRVAGTWDIELQREVFDQFVHCNEQYISQLLKKNFVKFPGEALADFLSRSAMRWINSTGVIALEAVPRRFPTEQICEWLLPRYEKADYKPGPLEIEALQRCVSVNPQLGQMNIQPVRLIQGFCRFWTGEWLKLQSLLSESDPLEFQTLAAWAIQTAGLKAEASAHLLTRAALFLGFVGTGFSADNKKLLRALTFLPIESGQIAATPAIGRGACRRVVLKLLSQQSPSSKKKKGDSECTTLNVTAANPLQERVWPKPEPPPPSWATFQRNADGSVLLTESSPDIPPHCIPGLADILGQLCVSNSSQIAFFPFSGSFVVAELLPQGPCWTATACVLNGFRLKQFHNNPFGCLTRLQNCQTLSSSYESQSVRDHDLFIRMIQLAGRNKQFRLWGSREQNHHVVNQLFQALPEQWRQRCFFFTGQLPADHALSGMFTVSANHDDLVGSRPIIDLKNKRYLGPELPFEDSPFERLLALAPGHKLWRSMRPYDVRVFDQLFKLCELMADRAGDSDEEQFFEQTIRMFIDINALSLQDALLRRLTKNAGKVLGPSLLTRASEWVFDEPASVVAVLRTGFDREWIVRETVTWLLQEKLETVSASELQDVNELVRSSRGDKSSHALMLRALNALLAGKVSELAFWTESFERRDDGEQLFELLCERALRTVKDLGGIKCQFSSESTTANEAGLGLIVALEDHGTSLEKTLAVRLAVALFGYEITEDDGFWEGGQQIKKCPGVTGKFWPHLIELLHACHTPSEDDSHVAT